MMKKFGFGLVTLGVSLVGLPLCAWAHAGGHGRAYSRQHGGVGHGPSYLGIDVRDVNDDAVSTLKLKDSRGAEITKVDHDGPAGKMGLREHDVVTQMNGIAVEGEKQMRRMMQETPPGRTVVLVVSREGQQITMTAQMADRIVLEKQAWEQHVTAPVFQPPPPQAPATVLPADEDGASESIAPPAPGPAPSTRYSRSFLGSLLTSPSYTGAMLERMGPQLATFFGVPNGTGLLVRGVEVNSPAAMAGIKAGDVLVRANTRALVSMTDWAKTIRDAKGRPVTVVVVRDRQEKTLTLTPDSKRRAGLEWPYELPDGTFFAFLTRL